MPRMAQFILALIVGLALLTWAASGVVQTTAQEWFERDVSSRAQLVLDKTQSRLEDVQREIDGMRLKRRDVETTLESTIQTLRNTLDYVREQEQRERDERILLHRPRHQDLTAESRVADFPQEARR